MKKVADGLWERSQVASLEVLAEEHAAMLLFSWVRNAVVVASVVAWVATMMENEVICNIFSK